MSSPAARTSMIAKVAVLCMSDHLREVQCPWGCNRRPRCRVDPLHPPPECQDSNDFSAYPRELLPHRGAARREAMRDCANLRGTMSTLPAGPPTVPPLLAGRRTVRFYRDAPVPEGVVRALLESAAHAPSAHNAQPVRYVV